MQQIGKNMHSTSLTSLFPQELIDHIIDDSGMDSVTLRSCALVCRAFLRPSQARIFSHLDCVLSGFDLGFERLYDVLSESPHLIRHITSLRICFVPVSSDLVEVLNILTHVRDVTLEHISWPSLDPEDATAIRDLCQRSNLSYVRMYEVQGITLETVSELFNSPSLTHLSLNLGLSPPQDTSKSALESQMRLITLDVNIRENLDIFVSWLAQRRSLSSLQRLSIFWTALQQILQRLIDASATSLEVFWLIADFEGIYVGFPISFIHN
jgi:hypothetical protein